MRKRSFAAGPFALLLLASPASAATLQVGPTRTYTTVRDAILAASDGDVIEIDAGLYSGDVATIRANDLTIRGVGGMAHLDAAGENESGKGIWVAAGDRLVVENIEFSGATVPDQNGAGIRVQGTGITIRNCYFHDNEDGILAGDNDASDIVIEDSHFEHNGFGDGYSHNIYINHVRSLNVRGSWFHRAHIGHEFKSRAHTTILIANRFSNEDGDASYEVDLPNGGLAILIGNVIEQGPGQQNPAIVSFAEEGASNPMQAIYLVNNTIVNDADRGTFVRVAGSPTFVSVNNLFVGPGTQYGGASPGDDRANIVSADGAGLFIDRAGYDYRLADSASAIDGGAEPGEGGGMSLAPTSQYLHPASSEERVMIGAAYDVGAFEHGNAPPMDGGTSADAGTTQELDAGSQADAGHTVEHDGGIGADAGGASMSGGCGCRVSRGGSESAPFVVLALGWIALRRRQGCRSVTTKRARRM